MLSVTVSYAVSYAVSYCQLYFTLEAQCDESHEEDVTASYAVSYCQLHFTLEAQSDESHEEDQQKQSAELQQLRVDSVEGRWEAERREDRRARGREGRADWRVSIDRSHLFNRRERDDCRRRMAGLLEWQTECTADVRAVRSTSGERRAASAARQVKGCGGSKWRRRCCETTTR